MDTFLDIVLRIVSVFVIVALAIPVLVLIIEMFYTLPIFASVAIVTVIPAGCLLFFPGAALRPKVCLRAAAIEAVRQDT